MINRRNFVTGIAAAGLTSRLFARDHGPKLDIDLELYSLRNEMKRDVPGTLARVRQMGFNHVEVSNLYGLTAPEFRSALDKEGVRATSMVASYNDLQTNLVGVQRNLDALGARWAILPWIPHGEKFERTDVDPASKNMNAWGATLTHAGYEFGYHPHGYEFQPAPEATLFDTLAKATEPDTVEFELDTFWIAWLGQDCVALMQRYPGRFRLMHLKPST
jgi:sugar phosphate isomerase/epimerase